MTDRDSIIQQIAEKHFTNHRSADNSMDRDICAHAIRAALADERLVPQWKPTESAPRGVDNEFLGVCDGVVDKTWEGWTNCEMPVYVHADWVSWNPTHWMPLPKPPAGEPK